MSLGISFVIFLLAVIAIVAELILYFFLGEKLSNLKIISKVKYSDEEHGYIVKPSIPLKILSSYIVLASPTSKEVYEIRGIGKFKSRQTCVDTKNAVEEKIRKKCKINDKNKTLGDMLLELAGVMEGASVLRKGDLQILILCEEDFNATDTTYILLIAYTNESLEKKAEKERIKLKSEQIDDSALKCVLLCPRTRLM